MFESKLISIFEELVSSEIRPAREGRGEGSCGADCAPRVKRELYLFEKSHYIERGLDVFELCHALRVK